MAIVAISQCEKLARIEREKAEEALRLAERNAAAEAKRIAGLEAAEAEKVAAEAAMAAKLAEAEAAKEVKLREIEQQKAKEVEAMKAANAEKERVAAARQAEIEAAAKAELARAEELQLAKAAEEEERKEKELRDSVVIRSKSRIRGAIADALATRAARQNQWSTIATATVKAAKEEKKFPDVSKPYMNPYKDEIDGLIVKLQAAFELVLEERERAIRKSVGGFFGLDKSHKLEPEFVWDDLNVSSTEAIREASGVPPAEVLDLQEQCTNLLDELRQYGPTAAQHAARHEEFVADNKTRPPANPRAVWIRERKWLREALEGEKQKLDTLKTELLRPAPRPAPLIIRSSARDPAARAGLDDSRFDTVGATSVVMRPPPPFSTPGKKTLSSFREPGSPSPRPRSPPRTLAKADTKPLRVDENVIYTGSNQTFASGNKLTYGEVGVVKKIATKNTDGKMYVKVKFPKNKGNVNCPPNTLMRLQPLPDTGTPGGGGGWNSSFGPPHGGKLSKRDAAMKALEAYV